MLIFAILFTSFTVAFSGCPSGTVAWQSSCFQFNTNLVGFATAEYTCTQLGGHLASVHDGFTNSLLEQQGYDYFHGATQSACWIGGSSLQGSYIWNWTDGTDLDFMDWKSGEPQHNPTKPGCMGLSLRDGLWTAKDCETSMPFICDLSPPPTRPPITVLPPTQSTYCGFGWTYYPPAHACYGGVFYTSRENWTLAEESCQAVGGHLPSIHSYDEMSFLGTYVNTMWVGFWTGLTTRNNGRTWSWSDGTPLDYLSWMPGAPYFSYTNRCVYLPTSSNNIGYYDSSCDAGYAFICKKYL